MSEQSQEQRRQALITRGVFAYCTCCWPLIPRSQYARPTDNCDLHRELAQRWDTIADQNSFDIALDDALTRLEVARGLL